MLHCLPEKKKKKEKPPGQGRHATNLILCQCYTIVNTSTFGLKRSNIFPVAESLFLT